MARGFELASEYVAPVTPKLKVTSKPAVITFSSDPVGVMTHAQRQNGEFRTRRCGGRKCVLCGQGNKPQPRFYILCVHKGVEHWVELGPRHAKTFEPYSSIIGLRVKIRKNGENPQSTIVIDVLDGRDENVLSRDASPFIDKFCLKPIVTRTSVEEPAVNGRAYAAVHA